MIRLKTLLVETASATEISKDNLEKAKEIVSGLIRRGFSKLEAVGLAGNMSVESSVSGKWFTTSAKDKAGAYGLMQWQGDREKAIKAYASYKGMASTDLSLQLDFVKFELKDGYLLYPGDTSKTAKEQLIPGIPVGLVYIVNGAGKPTKPRVFTSADTEVKRFKKSIKGSVSDTTTALCTNTFRAGTPHIDRRISNATAIYNYIQKNGLSTEEKPEQTTDTNKKTTKETGIVYVVKSGDTLSSIAVKYKTTVNDILKKNPGLEPDKLKIGQKINL